VTRLFLDTSAVVPLFLEEPQTAAAQHALAQASQIFAWCWMRVEAEAGFIRRQADRQVWTEWRTWTPHVCWLDLEFAELDHLCSFNRALRLRAADAGHLYVYEQACHAMPDLQLVTFDHEMAAVAHRQRMALWHPG